MFGPDSWLAIYSGFNFLPDTYASEVDNMPTEYLNANLGQMRSAIKNMVAPVPSHLEFLSRFCAYKVNTQ
ncbi:MAG: tryptophan halogenase [Paraglaciecola sp.]